MGKLSGRHIIITGAGSGVGRATAEHACHEGARVIALDRDAGRLSTLQTEISRHTLDVSHTDDWQAFAHTLPDASIDHLHLNAGIQSAPPDAPLSDYQFGNLSMQHYQNMMGVNVNGVVFGLHYLLAKMKPGGSIVITGSLAGIVPYDIDPLYAMSKHAVTGLVRSLTREFADRGLRINALCPGGIDTNIIPHDQRTDDMAFMQPSDIAEEIVALFLTEQSGHTWAKVSADKPAWVIHPPGKRKD